MTINRSDESRQVRPGLRASGPSDDDEADDEGMEANSVSGDGDGDEDDNAPQGVRAGVTSTGYARQREDEASETSQKSKVMGGRGMKGGSEKIEGTDLSDADEMKGSAHKVTHGRDKPSGHAAEVDGAHQGSSSGGNKSAGAAMHRNTLGHGEREATIGGAHQGQHGSAEKTGSGFGAGGKLSREQAKGPSGTKR
jgi:hypothetical protein